MNSFGAFYLVLGVGSFFSSLSFQIVTEKSNIDGEQLGYFIFNSFLCALMWPAVIFLLLGAEFLHVTSIGINKLKGHPEPAKNYRKKVCT